MQDFRKLDIYKRAIEYCSEIYRFSANLPDDEKYGLISQMRRAGTSIPLNISEGAGCTTNKEFAHFVSFAYRSVNEVLTCLELIEKLGLDRDIDNLDKLRNEGMQLSRMTYVFIKKVGGGISFK